MGSWFGRPMDNDHKLVTASYNEPEELLILTFNNNERLTVWNPADLSDDIKHLRIHRAQKVLWEWYHYGKPNLPTFTQIPLVTNPVNYDPPVL